MDESQLSSDQEEMIDVRQTETADKNGESTISTYASFTPLLDEEGKGEVD